MVTIDFMKNNKERRRRSPQIGNHMPLGCAFYVEKLKINISR